MKRLFNDNWQFAKTEADRECPEETGAVHIPHDWLIGNSDALYETSFGHYKKTCYFEGVSEKSIRLYFEGVYMDSTVYVNGKEVCSNGYGYSSFEADITDFVREGENEIYVLVRHRAPNTRWYSGAGIFRDVWLYETSKSYLPEDGIYFHTEKKGGAFDIIVSVETSGAEGKMVELTLSKGGAVLFSAEKKAGEEFSFTLDNLSEEYIWDTLHPNLLDLTVSLKDGDKELDSVTQKVGLREIEYNPDKGFFLNGRSIKLNGVCLHHDLGCLGAAFNKSAARRQLQSMLDMGANAVRTSHNMPAVGFMELCDEMGILVDSEAYDMWELPKTEFDNARFFKESYEKDVASWIRRDRNHPSVIMWSVGNEIYDTHASPHGREIARNLHNAVRKHDPLCNAPTTIGSNYMPWEGAQNCAREVDLAGYNYGESLYAAHHKDNPQWRIYGSETTSGVKSRGVYHFPLSAAFLTHEDMQCSSLGNCRAGISADIPQKIIAINRDTDYCAGMFIWTGADYIGEPSPYSTKNAYYGSIDTAGLRKDSYYLYQSAWTDKPVLHLMPYWDFNEGQLIDVVAYTNLSEAELFLNGKSMGRKQSEEYTITWQIPYEKGEIRVVGKTAEGEIIEDVKRSFGDSSAIKLTAEKTVLNADGEDIAAVVISTVDKDGNPVENARDYITIKVEGGALVGFDNGDSTDYDSYKSNTRKLFSGKAAAYIAASDKAGAITVTAAAKGLEPAAITINAKAAEKREGSAAFENITEGAKPFVPVRKLELSASGSRIITPENPVVTVKAEILPENADFCELKWTAVNDSGIETNIAAVEAKGNTASVSAVGDGAFRLRCTCNNGKPYPEVISEYEFTAEGFGAASINPYDLVRGCLYTDSISEMDNVSEGGVNITRDNNIVGFAKTDFGKYGTDSFSVRIINWHKNDPFNFKLWLGKPNESGSELVGEYTYQADFIWQTYIENSYALPYTLKGERDIYFEFDKTDFRISFGGFTFLPRLKAYERINAADCDLLHGDNYEIKGESITGIGNNVFIMYDGMDFAEGTSKIVICGRTRHENDSIHIHFHDDKGVICREIIEFPYSDNTIEVEKELPDLRGNLSVEFQFLPGCDFDFESFSISRK